MKISEIKTAVETTLEVDIGKSNRKRGSVEAKIIFFLISKAFTTEKVGVIVEMTGRTHCIASHYRKLSIDLLKYNKYFREKYVRCLQAVNTNEEDMKNLITPDYLQNVIIKQKRHEECA